MSVERQCEKTLMPVSH